MSGGKRARVTFVEGRAFARALDLKVLRSALADHPSIEIHLFRNEDDLGSNRPTLTVFYLGVPDTTPEFTQASDAEAYLAHMLR
jgi:hypothetical protein